MKRVIRDLKNFLRYPLNARMHLAGERERERERESTEQKGVEMKFHAYSPILMGLKIVVTIAATEFVIMVALYAFGAEQSMPRYLIALIDPLMLGIVTSVVIVYWVVNPMKIYRERLQIEEATLHSKRFTENIVATVPSGLLVIGEPARQRSAGNRGDPSREKSSPSTEVSVSYSM